MIFFGLQSQCIFIVQNYGKKESAKKKILTKSNTIHSHSLKKLKIELPYNPEIPLLGIYPEKTVIWKDTSTPVLIAALFSIAKKRKQPKWPSTEE